MCLSKHWENENVMEIIFFEHRDVARDRTLFGESKEKEKEIQKFEKKWKKNGNKSEMTFRETSTHVWVVEFGEVYFVTF
jgi:hypothetical protein